MPLLQGQVLNNRYRLVRLLGQGGFGAVYRAWDITFIITGLGLRWLLKRMAQP